MRSSSATAAKLFAITKWMLALLIVRVVAAVFSNFSNYFPPNFEDGFLVDREAYFYGIYQYAFYAHIISGPVSLLAGLLLMNKSLLRTAPQWHRRIGKLQAMSVLFIMAPSGLVMSYWAATGRTAAAGLGVLAVVTAFTVVQGWRFAVQRQFVEHQLWMTRCFLLLNSAVVLRVIGGALTVLNIQNEWSYPCAAWASWIVPLVVFETFRRRKTKRRGRQTFHVDRLSNHINTSFS